ncbi:hypothetical protein F511_38759 [Dorcoceras hygrometricum]|uniref:Uncharacterized protein n=1 Tax=Dorcoceras hygrometricum TaxID=472368 RepID=A0A2Z7ANU6_9LAMI|nr:hypothetical protein F511_38759 [Dorcoceras hygrometricum]
MQIRKSLNPNPAKSGQISSEYVTKVTMMHISSEKSDSAKSMANILELQFSVQGKLNRLECFRTVQSKALRSKQCFSSEISLEKIQYGASYIEQLTAFDGYEQLRQYIKTAYTLNKRKKILER